MPESRVSLLVTLAMWGSAFSVGVATEPKTADPAADADLLEFLGSVDSGADTQAADDGSWIDYLAQTDIGKVAKNAGPHQAKPVPGGQPADADAGEKKND